MKDMGKKENNKKHNHFKGSASVLQFDRKKRSTSILKTVQKKQAHEKIKKVKDIKKELSQIWDEDLCE